MARTCPDEFKKFWNLLPRELRSDAWLFPVVRGGKEPDIPKGESWQDEKHRLDPEQAFSRLEEGKNVGISFRGRGLIVDIDDIQGSQDYFKGEILDTLIVRTRSWGERQRHLFGKSPPVEGYFIYETSSPTT